MRDLRFTVLRVTAEPGRIDAGAVFRRACAAEFVEKVEDGNFHNFRTPDLPSGG
jgi:hypothetical protein